MRRKGFLLFLLVGALGLGVVTCFHSSSVSLVHWTSLGPDGTLAIRSLSKDGSCPTLSFGSESRALTARPLLDSKNFPMTVCETVLTEQPPFASLDGEPVALPPPTVARIAVFGDTGCRLKEGEAIQACDDPSAWPLKRVAATIARWKPDLVIHVGDYHYREMDCPPGNDGCAGSVTGDNWDSWNQDFFSQVEPLLSSAPWIFIRGNHEVCKRAGRGWFNFLDPHATPSDCLDFTDPYSVSIGGWKLLILDSSLSDDDKAKPELVAVYRQQLAALVAQAGDNAWLVDHHPIWGIIEKQKEDNEETVRFRSLTLQAAAKGQLPAGLHKILSGHIHAFQSLTFGDAPSQWIVGNGGTEMIDPMPSVTGETIDERTVTASQTEVAFGFVTIELSGKQLTAELRDQDGNVLKSCQAKGDFNCEF